MFSCTSEDSLSWFPMDIKQIPLDSLDINLSFKFRCHGQHVWRSEIEKFELIEDSSTFWDNWKQIGENIVHQTEIPNVNGRNWEDHFKNLFSKIDEDIAKILPHSKSDVEVMQVLV